MYSCHDGDYVPLLQFVVNTLFALIVGGIFFMRDDSPRGMADRY